MRANKLKRNRDKMGVLLVGQTDPEIDVTLILDGVSFLLKEKIHSLGVLPDPRLLLDKHVIARGIFQQFQLVSQL